jgi:hypothetical protein
MPFTLRMQFDLHKDTEEITHQLLRLTDKAPVEEIMVFSAGEELNNGHETLEEIKQWLDASRPYREALQNKGINISLNPWNTVLHCDRGRKLKPSQNWQTMVDPKGNKCDAVVCYLDAGWQKYYLEAIKMYAQENVRIVWIEDDMRFHNHSPLTWGGCFCPLHIAEFNKRAGTNAGREEIVEKCLAPGKPHLWREIWLDMWQETILSFLSKCKNILNANGVQMGLMSSSMSAHAAEGRRWKDWWNAIGNSKQVVHRPHFWSTYDTTGSELPGAVINLDQNRSIQPENVESGPEIENFPYGRWHKSFRQTFAQMALAQILGSTNLNISLYDFMGNNPDYTPERAEFLKRVRPDMDWLGKMFPMDMRTIGVGVPWSEDMGRKIHTTQGKEWTELVCPVQGWANWLQSAGIAVSAVMQQNVNALAGPVCWSFSDDTIYTLLKSGVLLDGQAAAILTERGFGKFIGVNKYKFIDQEQVIYSIEHCANADFAFKPDAQMTVNDKPHTQNMFQAELDSKVNIISRLRGPKQNIVGHGAFIFQNQLGGRCAVVPWNASANVLLDVYRAVQLKQIVKWLANDYNTCLVNGGEWLIPQSLKNRDEWRAVVWNAGADEKYKFNIQLPENNRISNAWHLTPAGKRIEVAVDNNTIKFNQPFHQWELAVLV